MVIPITIWMTFLSRPHPTDLVGYTDESACNKNGMPNTGYAICDLLIIESASLPPSSSAHVVEHMH